MIERKEIHIGGHWCPAHGERFEVIDPSNEELVGSYLCASAEDVDDAVATARKTFDKGEWSRTPLEDRTALLDRLGECIFSRADELTHLITSESGAPSGFARAAQVDGSINYLKLVNDVAQNFSPTGVRDTPTGRVLIDREPVGVVGSIMPFNSPLVTLLTMLAPALLAGCTVVVKPDQQVALTSFVLGELLEEIKAPEGIVSLVPGGPDIGRYLVRHPDVDKIAFTGSAAVGRDIAAAAGGMMKRLTLELGGKSAAIILDDADLDQTLPCLVTGTTMHCGQGCFLVRRILVSEARHDELVDRLDAEFAKLVVGDAHDPDTQIGPLTTRAYRERVLDYIEIGKREKAKLVRGGGIPDGFAKGWFVEPTIFDEVDNSMRIAQEEIFGPVVVVETFADEADAIRQANDSQYGLSGCVFTADVEHGIEIARAIRTGTFAVNRFGINFMAPFGGFKNSGVGRKFGPEGFEEYFELKSIALP